MKDSGLRLNAKKSVLPPVQRTAYLGVMQARLSPARIESILATVKRVTHCDAFSKAVGSDGSCVQCDIWPAAHETLAVVAQDHRVFPEGQPILHDQGHAAMLTCLKHVEETVFPVTRPCVGGSMSSLNANDGLLLP